MWYDPDAVCFCVSAAAARVMWGDIDTFVARARRYDPQLGEVNRYNQLEHMAADEAVRLLFHRPLRAIIHLNDSQCPFGSRRDRHAEIGEGSLGDAPFRRIMTDERFAAVPKVLETPKGDDHTAADRRNLARLRSFLG